LVHIFGIIIIIMIIISFKRRCSLKTKILKDKEAGS